MHAQAFCMGICGEGDSAYPGHAKNNIWRASTDRQQEGCSMHIRHPSWKNYVIYHLVLIICFCLLFASALTISLFLFKNSAQHLALSPTPRSVRWLRFTCGDGQLKSISFAMVLAGAAVAKRRTEHGLTRRRRNRRPFRWGSGGHNCRWRPSSQAGPPPPV